MWGVVLTLGLTNAERALYEEALRSPHRRRIDLTVQDLAGNALAPISHMLLDGQVIVDAGAEVTRSASLTLHDPTSTLNFDTDSPDDGALYLDRAIQIEYCVYVEALSRWVEVPVFTGPITKLSRDGGSVSLELQGKETLAMGAVWNPYTAYKGGLMVSRVRDLMQKRAGETKFDFPNDAARIAQTVTLPRDAVVWDEAKKMTGSRGLWYDGRGWLRMQSYSTSPVYVFRDKDGGDVLTRPSVSFTTDDVKNVVEVLGAIPKGKKTNIRAVAHAPASHPMNHGRLGRNGVPRYMVEFVQDDNITTQKRAQEVANAMLAPRLLETVEVQFDAMPIPHLEPWDVVAIRTDEFSTDFRLRQFTIPLTSGSPMPVGYLKKLTPNRGKVRK